MSERPFTSQIDFNEERIHAAALYCSDGRFGEQIDDFLHNGRGWPRYDRLAVPGGPACLSGELSVFWESQAVEKQLQFLVQVHQLENIVLIAHDRCAFYREWLRIADAGLEERQVRDLMRAASNVGRLLPRLSVTGYFARRTGTSVGFVQIL